MDRETKLKQERFSAAPVVNSASAAGITFAFGVSRQKASHHIDNKHEECWKFKQVWNLEHFPQKEEAEEPFKGSRKFSKPPGTNMRASLEIYIFVDGVAYVVN